MGAIKHLQEEQFNRLHVLENFCRWKGIVRVSAKLLLSIPLFLSEVGVSGLPKVVFDAKVGYEVILILFKVLKHRLFEGALAKSAEKDSFVDVGFRGHHAQGWAERVKFSRA